jgi:hypothetical protein
MNFYDPEKVKRMPPIKRKKALRLLAMIILFNLFLVSGYFVLSAILHQSVNPRIRILIFAESAISFPVPILYWLGLWSAFKRIPYSDK